MGEIPAGKDRLWKDLAGKQQRGEYYEWKQPAGKRPAVKDLRLNTT